MKLYRSRSSYPGEEKPRRARESWRYRARSRYQAVSPRASRQDVPGWRDAEHLSRARRALPVFLCLCVLLALVLPMFLGQVTRAGVPEGETVVRVEATLDGVPWKGRLSFRLSGAARWSGSLVPYEMFLVPGVYSVTVTGGGPPGAKLTGVTPPGSRLGRAGETLTFTAVFSGQ
ncbi:MAG TPA: hypothetical protein PLO19_05270 [Candidatus Cryosericum sp.]|nr:hypothetical protein [Candidatus Cryosericum sp.]HPS70130.1 hypothetical protein [Candidatus Cryosericum sp.]